MIILKIGRTLDSWLEQFAPNPSYTRFWSTHWNPYCPYLLACLFAGAVTGRPPKRGCVWQRASWWGRLQHIGFDGFWVDWTSIFQWRILVFAAVTWILRPLVVWMWHFLIFYVRWARTLAAAMSLSLEGRGWCEITCCTCRIVNGISQVHRQSVCLSSGMGSWKLQERKHKHW